MIRAYLGKELISRGYEYKELTLDRTYKQYFLNGKLVISEGANLDYPFVSNIAKDICRDKTKSHGLAQKLNIPIPQTLQTLDLQVAKDFLDTYKRVIVKPSNLRGGLGLTLNITNYEQLEAAIINASMNGDVPLIQEQFIGEEIRFTILGGKVRSAVLRQTPRVIGDGVSSVAELVVAENEIRETLVFPKLTYPQLDEGNIPAHFLNDATVPADHEVVEFSNATMIRNGASFYDIIEEVHPSYIAIVEQMARSVNPPFLIVDMMFTQWKSEPKPGDYVFLEFNTSPALAVYTSLRGGSKQDIIGELADLVDKYAQFDA